MINAILAEQLPAFKFVTVNFAGSIKPYTYKTTMALKSGDFVVVDAPSGLTVVTAVDVDVEFEGDFQIKWIVDKVNSVAYKKLVTLEQELISEMGGVKRV